MIKNLQISRDVIFSQRIMLELVKKEISREKAYKIVQDNAMKSWKGKEDFKTLVMKDSRVKKLLSEKEIKGCFNIRYFVRNIGKIYKRLGLDR